MSEWMRDIAGGRAGSLWVFPKKYLDRLNEHGLFAGEHGWPLVNNHGVNERNDKAHIDCIIPYSSPVMYLGYNDLYGDKKIDMFFDIDGRPPKYYKVMAVTVEGQSKIGWISDSHARHLRKLENEI